MNEFCKDGGPVVRECPDCIDKYIELAERYAAENAMLEATIVAANKNAEFWKQDYDAALLQVEAMQKVVEAARAVDAQWSRACTYDTQEILALRRALGGVAEKRVEGP